MFKILRTSTTLSHVLHPFTPITSLKDSKINKIIGIALFILASLTTCGGMSALYLYTAQKKQNTLSKITQANKQLNKLKDHKDLEGDLESQEQIKKIQQIFNNKLFLFEKRGSLHEFHDVLTNLTLKVRDKDKIKKTWELFLNSINESEAYVPNFKWVTLDVSAEKFLLENPNSQPKKVKIEVMQKSSNRLKSDLLDVAEILNESFPMRANSKNLESYIFRKNRFFVVARDEDSDKIEGIAELNIKTKNGSEYLHIRKVARRANASKKGIGTKIFSFLNDNYFPNYTSQLEVFEDNLVAQGLYKKFGFNRVKTIPKYHIYPIKNQNERLWVMERTKD